MGSDPRLPVPPVFTRRRLLASAGGLILARFAMLDSTDASAQATSAAGATPITEAGNIPFNLAAIGPLPIDDLKDYAFANQEIRTPGSYYDFAAYFAQTFPVSVLNAIAASNPQFIHLTSLSTPPTQDAAKITQLLDSFIVAPADGAAPNWDPVFAAAAGGSPAGASIGDRNIVWTYESSFTYATPPKPIKATGILFSRGRYAVLIAVRDIAKPATTEEIAAIAKTIDARLTDGVAFKITSSTRPVAPLIDFSAMMRQPASAALTPTLASIGLKLRAFDGKLLRSAFESDQAFALAGSGDKTAVAQANAISYKAALDLKATILVASTTVPSPAGRDAILNAFFPDLARSLDFRGTSTKLIFEQYSLPEGADPEAVLAMLDDRRTSDLDHDYKQIDIPLSMQLDQAPRFERFSEFAIFRPHMTLDEVAEKAFADMTRAKSSAEYSVSFEFYRREAGELMSVINHAFSGPGSPDVQPMSFKSVGPAANAVARAADQATKFNRIQLFTMMLTPGQYAPRDALTIDTMVSDKASELRTAMASICDRFLTSQSYTIQAPAPKTPPPPLPAMADLTTTPFVGLAGLAPFPHGKLAKYAYYQNEPPAIAFPIVSDQWSSSVVAFQPSPIADVVYNLPITLAYVSTLAQQASGGQGGPPNRLIRTHIYLDPVSARTSWSAVLDAVAKPQKSPSKLGEQSKGWISSGASDPNLFSPFNAAAIFFARESFGVVVEIRDYVNKPPTLKEVATLAAPIDQGIAAAIAGSPPASALLGIPTFGPGGISYLSRLQQVRCAGGALIATQQDAGDPNAFKLATTAYKMALVSKATVILSQEPVPLPAGVQLFSGNAGGTSPTGLVINLSAELTILPKSANPAAFAAALIDRLKAKYPNADVAPLPAGGSGANAVALATVVTSDTSGQVATLVAQGQTSDRVAEIELRTTATDLSTVSASLLAANAAYISAASSLVAQVLKGSRYLFKLGS